MKQLKNMLPEGKEGSRWQRGIAESCIVTNMETWNHNFSQWPVQRVNEQ